MMMLPQNVIKLESTDMLGADYYVTRSVVIPSLKFLKAQMTDSKLSKHK